MAQQQWKIFVVCLIAVFSLSNGCSSREEGNSKTLDADGAGRNETAGTLVLASSAFKNGKAIPKKYTGQGEDLSPPFTLPKAPEGTKTWAIICDDPDAPSPKKPFPDPWVHWVIYNIPADTRELPEGIARTAELKNPVGVRQGVNSFSSDSIGYNGPLPPPGSGTHRYFFKLYALDTELDLSGDIGKEVLLAAMKGHTLDRGELVGTYEIAK